MKSIVIAVLSVPLCALAITDAQRMFLDGRRIAVDRKIENGRVITTWARNGKTESVVTNVLKDVVGVRINNPLEDRIVSLTNSLESVRAELDSTKARLVETVRKNEETVAKLTEKRAEFVEKKNKAALQAVKAVYQVFIDVIDELLGVE